MTDLSKYEGHTPGPWDAEGPDEFGDYNIVQKGTNPAIAAVVSNLREPEIIAEDARLIEDAPTILAYARELEARNADLVEALGQVIEDIDALISDSDGVAGLHLNGDVAPWSDLTEGGRFGEWLQQIEVARRALSRAKGEEA